MLLNEVTYRCILCGIIVKPSECQNTGNGYVCTKHPEKSK